MYDDWRGLVYPAGLARRDWFTHYATLFDTVEVNASFYGLPTPSTVERWAAQAPPGFLYAVKLASFATHRKKLLEPSLWMPRHLEWARALGESLGPTLVQLPPRWRRNPARLDEALDAAPRDLRWAVEVRDPSWLHDDVFDVLARHGAALCLHDLLPVHPWVLTTSWTYVRFHGPDALRRPYAGAYGGRRLSRHADQLAAWLADGIDVYAYFNNDIGAAAIGDARWLRDRLA
jgi:uncharacterized protein YecE (DUF72 family)